MRSLIVLLLTAVATARLAPLYTHTDRIPGRYIVKLKAGQDVDMNIAALGNTRVFYKYTKMFPGFAALLSDRMVEFLRNSDAVEYIEEDGVVYASSVASWGLDRIDQMALPLDDVYSPIGDGNGVDVYVIDTGINANHEDFGGRSDYGYDAIGGTGDDCNGHGTHCAGTVAGIQYGVAKAANVYGVRVLNCLGSGSWSGVVAGCEWVADNHNGPSVASMSLGGGASDIVDDAVQYMIDAGITVAVAAGNDDDDACYYSPARSAPAITVGATDSTDTRAYFSNYGTCVDIFAPGVSITSAWIRSNTASNTISGTSMACPHVAGAAAILLGMNQAMTPSEVKNTILSKSIAGAISDPESGSPNLLLYVGDDNGGGSPPVSTTPSPVNPTCGGTFDQLSGTITSPNYPSPYPNDQTCDYIITAPSDKAVTLDFDGFVLEDSALCRYDSLEIFDATGSSLGKYCGENSPGQIVSSGSTTVRFVSDSSESYSGFSASYSIGEPPEEPETGDCGHTFTSEHGVLTSPNYPSNYDNNVQCEFFIQGSINNTVTLTFTDFDVEQQLNCGWDAVQIYETDANGALLAKLCGNSLPAPVSTSSSSMYIKFSSDSSVQRTGFSAYYNLV